MSRKAFTLVELAIVLIIIGLITGGVVGANSLIESANRQALINEAQQYETAINAFVLEYDELPGLFDEAQDYWGSTYTALDGSSYTVPNGQATYLSGAFVCSAPWVHLGLAEIIDTKYADLPCNLTTVGAGSTQPVAASGEDHAWDFSDNTNFTGTPFGRTGPVYSKNRKLYLTVSAPNPTGHESHGVITAKSARAIDKKLDDGDPANGSFFAIKGYYISGSGYQSGCVDQEPTVAADTAVSYDLSTDDPNCRPMFFVNVNK